MLASFPASMLNQNGPDLGIPNRIDLKTSRFRLTILTEDARATVQREPPNSLDLVFADGGVGKHVLLDEMLALLRPGGIYICDDTKPHPMWPPEHAAKIPPLMEALAARQDFRRIYIDWSSGVVVMVKLAT